MIDALEIEREKILIVGDNTDVRDLIATLFGATHVILTAHSEKRGSPWRSRSDLILLDVQMPDMDGFAVCGRLKSSAKTENIPVIFLTEKQEKNTNWPACVREELIIFPHLSLRRLWKLVFAINYRKKAC